MRGRPLILLLWGIGQSLLSYGAVPPLADAHELSAQEKQQVDILVEKIEQALAQQPPQQQQASTYGTIVKIIGSFFEGGYGILKLAALIILIVIVCEILVRLSHFLPRYGSGKNLFLVSEHKNALRLPFVTNDHKALGESLQEYPDKAPPTITVHEPAPKEYDFRGGVCDLKVDLLEIDQELLKRVIAQIAYAHSIGLDPAPLPAHAVAGTSKFPRVPMHRMYPLLMAQIAHAKSMGLESSLPEHYGQNVPNGH